MTGSFWLEHAWLPDGIAHSVRVVLDGERVAEVQPSRPAEPGDRLLPGLAIPGAANGHSHAFHRALRGAGAPGDTFWGWRETMYRIAGRLTPQNYYLLARSVYGEMLAAGYTSVAEFHYVHHQPDGTPYEEPNAMGLALARAASDAGIRLTLLDTCYLSAGFGAPLEDAQRRFSDGSAAAWRTRVEALAEQETATFRVGAAIHSVRAVDERSMATVVDWAEAAGRPLHVHLSEQVAENERCLAATGRTPAAVLADAGAWRIGATAVHAVHLTEEDVALLGGGANVCLCPSTEADLADGIAPALALSQAGVPLGIGSDQNVCEDPFAEVRDLEMHERLVRGTRENFGPGQLVAALADDGQRIAGWPESRRIAAGALADWAVLDADSAVTAGARLDRLPQIAGASSVRTVVVGGRVVVSEGRCLALDPAAGLADLIHELREDA